MVFISVINLLNCSCLALVLGDLRLRVVLCFPSWLASQVGIVIDANIHTFPTVQPSTMISTPAVLSVALCCALYLIHGLRRHAITVGSKTLSLSNVITFASTTLAWMLTLVALTPPMKAHFRFGKRFAAPVVVAFLVGGLWTLLQIFFENDMGMHNLVLLDCHVSQRYRLTTVNVLVERLVSILGRLGSRLMLEPICLREKELLFVRRLVEYASPFETFPR